MKFLLQISAELENVCSLRPDGNGGVNSVTMPYFFHLNCEKCGEITDEQCTYLNQRVSHKGKTYNHVLKCKGCDRVGTVKLISGSGKEYTAADSGAYVPLMVFDVEGLLMHRYVFNGGWEVFPVSGNSIKVNLVGGGFVGDGVAPPVVRNLRSRFVRK